MCYSIGRPCVIVAHARSTHIRGRSTARAAGATDNTRYGTSRLSTRSFVAHHLGQISTAVQVADAETIANRAAHIAFTRSLGMR